MITATIIRRAGRGLLCVTVGLLTASCASHPWREDPNVTAGRWEVSPDPATARDTLPPRNDLTYTPDETPAPEPSMSIRPSSRGTLGASTRPSFNITTRPTTRPVAAPARPARKRAKPELTGVVTIGSEGSKFGSPGSEAHLDWLCGNGKGTCTVVVEVETPVNLDNEHLDLKLEAIDSHGRAVKSSAMTRQTGMIQGEKMTYELSVKPCGKVRLSAAAFEPAGGKEGIQSRWTVRVLRFRCH